MIPATVRLRTVFEDRNMLGKSQKSSGLNRSWFLLKPQHKTISDLASDLLRAFGLEKACPNGVVVSMEDYVLPPFESTRILKDKDIISVTKKRGALAYTIPLGYGRNSLGLEIVEQLPADKEFEKEYEGYEGEPEEDGPQVETTPAKNKVSKKRKASKECQTPKSKRSKHTTTEKCNVAENIGEGVLAKPNRSSVYDMTLSKKNFSKDKTCLVQLSQNELKVSKIDERSKDSRKSSSSTKRSCVLEENGEKCVDAVQMPAGISKVPSRSARRKKAKRQRLKVANREKKRVQQKEMFQWKEITGKKKKKWRMHKFSFSRRDDYKNPIRDFPGPSRMLNVEESLIANGPLEFDKLAPYSSLPKVGDVIAYRLIELSSTWTPELSSFRVGKISRYYPGSNHIVLAPVPEYPIAFEEGGERESESQPNTSLYAKDGTLKICFSCLINIRSVKRGNLNSRQEITGGVNRNGPSNYNTRTDKSHIRTQENGDAWERISRDLNAMKAEMSQEHGWSKNDKLSWTSSSFRA